MNKRIKKIVALIPCYNEEKGVGNVIDGFKDAVKMRPDFTLDVLVIDNSSSDNTARIAQEHGATVLHEPKKGKGNAMQLAFNSVPADADYVVMIDGDDTYQASELLRLIEPLDTGFCNVVMGSRLTGKIERGAMGFVNRIGNWMFSFLVRHLYKANVTDVLTGYLAWDYEAIHRLRPHLSAKGFGIEMDMVTKMAVLGEKIYCVPITYISRSGDSTLHPFLDGARILGVFTKNLFWDPEFSYGLKLPPFIRHLRRA